MESRLIVDSQLTASSSRSPTSGAWNARLNLTRITDIRDGGWIAADDDKDPWLLIDFIANVTITAIVSQGVHGGQHWVKNYTVSFGFHRNFLQDYKADGMIKVWAFVGSTKQCLSLYQS